VLDEYFTGRKPDRDAHGGSLASYVEDLGGQARLGVVLGAFDDPDGARRRDSLSMSARRPLWGSSGHCADIAPGPR
jgi:hypothetical protein